MPGGAAYRVDVILAGGTSPAPGANLSVRLRSSRRPANVPVVLGKMLLKTLVCLAVVFIGLGIAVRVLGVRVDALVHARIDLSLPQDVTDRPWAPVVHGHAKPSQSIQLASGEIHSASCRAAALGSYSLHVDHAFTFRATPGIRLGCPAARHVEHELSQATSASLDSTNGHDVLTFSSDDGTLLSLRGRR